MEKGAGGGSKDEAQLSKAVENCKLLTGGGSNSSSDVRSTRAEGQSTGLCT